MKRYTPFAQEQAISQKQLTTYQASADAVCIVFIA
jgi:hypothetical protein